MRGTRWLGIVALLLGAATLSSCCCPFGRRKGLTIPTPGGPVSVQQGAGGSATITTPDGKITMEEGKGATIQTPEGQTTIKQEGDKVTTSTDKGETMTTGGSVDDATVKKLDIPVFAGAKGQSSMDMAGQFVNASFQSDAPFSEVAAWYEKELGSGWNKATMSTEGQKMTSFTSSDGKKTVLITADEKGTVSIVLTRQTEKQ